MPIVALCSSALASWACSNPSAKINLSVAMSSPTASLSLTLPGSPFLPSPYRAHGERVLLPIGGQPLPSHMAQTLPTERGQRPSKLSPLDSSQPCRAFAESSLRAQPSQSPHPATIQVDWAAIAQSNRGSLARLPTVPSLPVVQDWG